MAYDIISDIHGCYDEMIALMQKLGYEVKDGTPSILKAERLSLRGI